MLTRNTDPKTLHSWLSVVNDHLDRRRVDRSTVARPKRNRDRERARREARALFRDYYTELGLLQ